MLKKVFFLILTLTILVGFVSCEELTTTLLQSPNGKYKINVTDNGITLIGPGSKVKLQNSTIVIDGGKVEIVGDGIVVIQGPTKTSTY